MPFAILGALGIIGVVFLVGFIHGRISPKEKPKEVKIRY